MSHSPALPLYCYVTLAGHSGEPPAGPAGGIINIGDVPRACLPGETCGSCSLSGVCGSVFALPPFPLVVVACGWSVADSGPVGDYVSDRPLAVSSVDKTFAVPNARRGHSILPGRRSGTDFLFLFLFLSLFLFLFLSSSLYFSFFFALSVSLHVSLTLSRSHCLSLISISVSFLLSLSRSRQS